MKHSRRTICIAPVFLFLALAGCSFGNDDGNGKHIWTNTSQRIVIDKTGGLAGVNETYDYVRDTLPAGAQVKLLLITVNNSNVHCYNDAFFYEVTITDESGLDETYRDNLNACNDTFGINFISALRLEEVITLLVPSTQ